MKVAMDRGKVLILLLFFILVGVCFSAFAAGDEPPPISGPKAMNLTADPSSIYLGGDTSIITATVYNDTNCTEPIRNIGVYFNTSLGGITYLSSPGVNIAPDTCWAQTNESGMAMAVLTSGLELGNAVVYAWTGGESVVNETVLVEFKQPNYGVTLIPDNQTKETASGENATFYIEVRNIGTGADLYSLNVTSTEADFAELNKTEVTLGGEESEVVALNVASYFAGIYNTTVEAVGVHSSANVTVTTVVRPFRNLSVTVVPELQTVAPGVNVQYTLTITNKGNADDRIHLAKEVPADVTATLSKDMTDFLSPEESEGVLLNISSEREGDYIVNITITSEGNASVSDLVTTRTVVTREGFEFDTGAGSYPSIAGVHQGTIIPNHTVIVKKMYTYPGAGTGGHTEYVEISNGTWCINASWNGYYGDYHTLTFPELFTLVAGEEYRYEIHTGSYPQIINKQNCTTLDGSFINCTSFEDVNGGIYSDWIPAIRLFP
jgi:hypothetical protein